MKFMMSLETKEHLPLLLNKKKGICKEMFYKILRNLQKSRIWRELEQFQSSEMFQSGFQ